MKKITVVSVKVGEQPDVLSIEADNEKYRELVGGWIEPVRIAEDIFMIVNEEGMIQNLPVNFAIATGNEQVLEIHGNVFFIGIAGEDFVSLTKEQIIKVRQMFQFNRTTWTVRT
ncbi:DUF3846 domain-containing protein [Priestia megaterium]|uniref:DUF3846 domain-containing protein n=1 Tax=Priestia megaterium TaxID=1404 RepID=UPI0023DAA914|nr:DUF3846 domain-containing protein [Priestia megaterium]MDF2010223.1 DUF3846 domain-containing protein [Priestia megaterium]